MTERARKGHALLLAAAQFWTEGLRISLHLHHAQGFPRRVRQSPLRKFS